MVTELLYNEYEKTHAKTTHHFCALRKLLLEPKMFDPVMIKVHSASLTKLLFRSIFISLTKRD